MKTPQDLREIALKFDIKGNILDIKPLGNGLINDTLKIKTDGPDDYVLQRVNNAIFKDVELLQHNIDCATEHIRRKLIAAGETDIDRKVLRFVPEKATGKTYWTDGETFWRVSVFIKDAFTYETVNPEYSYYAGKAFGAFEAMLADIPDTLGETIPDFHNMELRARQLREAVAEDKVGRMAEKEVQDILSDLLPYEEEMCKAERMYREGILPKRICHCDTKVNNMMFDKDGNILCVIDLDTLMPSFVFSDFGDFLRTAANTVAEDDPAIEKVDFKMDIFEAFARGYLESATFLTPVERDNLPYAACLFPYMQAVRFFADYINGDTYYKIKYPEHNLVRTRNQVALFHAAMSKVPAMQEFIKKHSI
ncbi:MAG: aminoglycoside phosphotransferase family protein [Bacteroidales bacterium]|nr:aminoglycoside phosphotransferase family protein [Bacteroidales bacterium]